MIVRFRAAISATPATNPKLGTWTGSTSETGQSRLAVRLPGREAQVLPLRPRPASCRSATTQSGPLSPWRASSIAWVLVEPRLS